jgi:hypothetical protein
VFFIITNLFQDIDEKKYFSKLKIESNTTRIFIINVKNNTVLYFNRGDFANKKIVDMASFYSKYSENDREKVKDWIYQICVDETKVHNYIEADIFLPEIKKTIFSLLRLVKYNQEQGVVHLESQFLKNITPHNYVKKKIKRKSSIPFGQVTKSVLSTIISKYKSTKGYTFSIRFLNVSQKAFNNDEEERFMILTLKNSVYPFASDHFRQRQLLDINSRELIIVDLKISSEEEAFRLAKSLANQITKSISINAFQDYVKFTIGIVENHKYYQDFDAIFKHAQEASLLAEQKDTQIYLYENTTIPELTHEKYREQIESMIKDNKIRYLFRPVVDIKNRSVPAYLSLAKSYDSPFIDYNEMMKYSSICGKSRELFAVIARGIINRFAEQNTDPNCRLFYLVSAFDFDNIETIIPQIALRDKVKLVLVFEEEELDRNDSSSKEITKHLIKFQSSGYELALLMNDKNLLLDPEVYKYFNYFVAATSMTNEIKRSGVSRLSIRTLIEGLLKYEKPIIAAAPEGWQEVELIVKSGIYLVSSEVIAGYNEMVIPVDKKKMERVSKLNKYL